MTEFTPDRIQILINTSLMTGIQSGSLPPDFKLPPYTMKLLTTVIEIMSPIFEVKGDTSAITFCMGFIEGFRHGRGDRLHTEDELGW